MQPDRLFVASFAPEGEWLGVGELAIADLSPKWIDFCTSMIVANPPWFDRTLGGPLDHIRLNFRWREGSAQLLLSVHGIACASTILLCGSAPQEEASEIDGFLGKIRAAAAPVLDSNLEAPFRELEHMSQRPLAASIFWPNDISEQDQDLLRELGWHLAAAFFLHITEDG